MTEQPSFLQPSPWISRFAPLIPPGSSVLDLACGGGRHARLLAGMGHQVEAVDRDAEALAGLAGIAGLQTRCADLEGGPWPYFGRGFDVVVVTNYLHRALMPNLFGCLNEGGLLIYEPFMVGNELLGKPSNPAFLLRSGELLELVRNRLRVLAFEQGEVAEPRPAVIQRIVARRGSVLQIP
ncbi:MAG: class I SAM-dependent methyltransferase [Rhodocyclaceae bacterium]|nr:class I SAM-dependent methyltransferase [Rhodocyclaceae bacterium]